MSEIANNERMTLPPAAEDGALQSRIVLLMAVSVGLAVVVSAFLAPWRVTTGLLLGGLLSLFNFHWTRSSIAALIQGSAQGSPVGARASRYLLRYFVIASVCIAAYKLNFVSLPATIAGLCSFVVALFAEAFRQFYFAVIH